MKSFLDIIKEEEKSQKHHVMAFGRMNPPTTGHLKVIDKVKDIAHKHGATHSVVTSHSQDAKKNPLSAEQKIKHLKRYSPGTHFTSSSKEHPTILHHAAQLHKKGVTHLHVVAGSDRVKEMQHLLHKYNGHEASHGKYHFKKITVHSAGHRDPDSEGSEGMSGTKMREHAKNKNFHEFRKGVPGHVPEKHAKELMHDVRRGMGLHEDVDRGLFKAIFVTGGPGSGKDIIIREAIAESKMVELNLVQACDYLNDKQKLTEKTSDFRREAIRNRGPLIINGPADDINRITQIKEELEDLGYETTMVFVNTTNEASQERNTKLARMMVESVRQDKWSQAQKNKEVFCELFENFTHIDNTSSPEDIVEDITQTYLNMNKFIEGKIQNDIAISWLESHDKLNINYKINSLFEEEENVKEASRFFKVKTNPKLKAGGLDSIPADNRAGDPNADNIKWDANKKRGSYTFRTYSEEKGPTLKVKPISKETNFSKDKEKDKIKKSRWNNTASGAVKTTGVGPEFDTRQQGTVYPMSGMGDVTYREQKEFSKFRKQFKEAIDDPGANDMGVGGVLGGSTNKEPMQTPQLPSENLRVSNLLKKKKKNVKI